MNKLLKAIAIPATIILNSYALKAQNNVQDEKLDSIITTIKKEGYKHKTCPGGYCDIDVFYRGKQAIARIGNTNFFRETDIVSSQQHAKNIALSKAKSLDLNYKEKELEEMDTNVNFRITFAEYKKYLTKQ